MKSVVMIAYFFPPEGNAGSYRPLRFVRHLAKNGWHTSVIAANPYRYERYDPDLLTTLPGETEVVRVRARDPWQALQAWREQWMRKNPSEVSPVNSEQARATSPKRFRSEITNAVRVLEGWWYRPDIARSWIRPATKATIELCRRKQVNVIWTTAGPISAWIVAQRASQVLGIPYVLDLRDPHGLDYYEHEVRQPQWVKRWTRDTMSRIFRESQSIVFLFDTVAESYCRAFPEAIDPSKIHIIPNGYEGGIEEFRQPHGNKCIILYTGTLSSYRYDTLLQALRSLKTTDPERARQLRILFVGDGMEQLKRDVASLDLSDIVEIREPMTYAETNRLQRESQALLILGRDSSRKGYELVAGAKLFSYLKAGRPIVGVLPQDETKRILNHVGALTIANVDSPDEIVVLLRKVLNAWSTANLKCLLPNPTICELYSADQQTAALVSALERIPMKQSFIPGLIDIPQSLKNCI